MRPFKPGLALEGERDQLIKDEDDESHQRQGTAAILQIRKISGEVREPDIWILRHGSPNRIL